MYISNFFKSQYGLNSKNIINYILFLLFFFKKYKKIFFKNFLYDFNDYFLFES